MASPQLNEDNIKYYHDECRFNFTNLGQVAELRCGNTGPSRYWVCWLEVAKPGTGVVHEEGRCFCDVDEPEWSSSVEVIQKWQYGQIGTAPKCYICMAAVIEASSDRVLWHAFRSVKVERLERHNRGWTLPEDSYFMRKISEGIYLYTPVEEYKDRSIANRGGLQ
jgi:hypothetical protein